MCLQVLLKSSKECIRDIERYGVPDSGCSDTEDVITDFFQSETQFDSTQISYWTIRRHANLRIDDLRRRQFADKRFHAPAKLYSG